MDGVPIANHEPVTLATQSSDRLAVLFDAHADRLYRLARRLVPTSEDACDLVQDTFLRAARSLTSVPQGLAVEEAWLVCVLVNLRRDEWRKTTRRKRHDANRATETIFNRAEDAFVARADIWRALDALSPRRRAVVVMHELEGMDVPSIATLLGISAITVRWHLSRGRRELMRTLKPYTGSTKCGL